MVTLSVPHIFAIVINLISLVFLATSLVRVRKYMRKNMFEESRHTLLFGFVHLRMYVYGYIFSVIAMCFLYWILLGI